MNETINEKCSEKLVTVDRDTYEYLLALNGRAEAVSLYLSEFVDKSYSVNIALALMMLGNVRHFGNEPAVITMKENEDA